LVKRKLRKSRNMSWRRLSGRSDFNIEKVEKAERTW
jgi:hypothetical protein